MAERITEQAYTGNSDERGTWVNTGHRIRPNTTTESTPNNSQYTSIDVPHHDKIPNPLTYKPQAAEKPRRHLSEVAKRRIKNGLVVVAISGIITASSVSIVNAMKPGMIEHTVQGALNNNLFAESPSNGVQISPQLTESPSSFGADQCMLPGGNFGVVTVNASIPEVPLLTNKDHPTLFTAAPWLTKKAEAGLNKADRAKISKYNTTSGYPELTINNMPFGITICDLGGGIVQVGNKFTINRSKLQVLFEDPGSISTLGATINPIQQLKSSTDLKLDPSKGEWATYPVYAKLYDGTNPKSGTVIEPVLNKAVTDYQNNISNEAVFKTMLALAKKSVGDQLGNFVNPPKKLVFQAGNKDFTDFLNKVILARLGANPNTTTFNDPHYIAQMDIAKDPVTKKLITENASITDIDLTQKASILGASVVSGFPSSTSPPIPAPTETPKPTPTPTVKP